MRRASRAGALFVIFHYMNRISSIRRSLQHAVQRHPKKSIAATLVVLAVLGGLFMGGGTVEAPQGPDVATEATVSLASVAVLSSDVPPLTAVGEVRSVSQAELRAERSGKVVGVYTTAGAFVPAGAILAELENAQERAAVLSAQGALTAAQAQLTKAQAGARGEDQQSAEAQQHAAETALLAARNTARNAYEQAYSRAEDALLSQSDQLLRNPETANPTLNVRGVSYDERKVLEDERVVLGDVLDTWQERTGNVFADETLDLQLADALAHVERMQRYVNDVGQLVARQELTFSFSSSDKSAEEAIVRTARNSLDTARAALNSARSGLAQAESAAEAAQQTATVATVGARSEDILAAEAAVQQAQGGLLSAQATLNTTRIRTPIAGTVTTLNIAPGDFVGAQESAAVVANEGALQVEVFVSDGARARITEGGPVLVDGVYEGTVTSLAPGLDPETKQARVTVGLNDTVNLANGSYVEVAFLEGNREDAESTANAVDGFRIPVAAIKVLPRGLAVFTVEDGVLVSLPITEGPILGASMLVRDGVEAGTMIVRDVRGLREGDGVTVITE